MNNKPSGGNYRCEMPDCTNRATEIIRWDTLEGEKKKAYCADHTEMAGRSPNSKVIPNHG